MDLALTAAERITAKRDLPVFDANGFLLDHACWTYDVARSIACTREIALVTPAHWAILAYLRDYHARFSVVPPLRSACRARHLPRGTLHRLFGAYIEAWRIAGLPDPGEEAKAYMSSNVTEPGA